MQAKIGCILLSLCAAFTAHSQKFTLERSRIEFFSDAAIEDIRAENSKASGLLNVSTGEVVVSIPIREFEFEKALMQEHFNEKYLESEKFPKSIFQGKLMPITPDEPGEQRFTAKGKLTIHGVTHEIQVPGTLEWRENRIYATASFIIRLEDYQIRIPQLLWQNIAEEVKVSIELIFKPL